ncbi:uncharacterized protein BKA55DRAFT_539422 [Fusarium redolens]|uniref:Uncharacterized protein n=1 Tax=Fusarium redolens TaxID=48865 RepID=A0A9P9H295_FUSRE|nr:uncharacterized protein BKA55DRAFT_539422 [Fusarium redolens]KAH7249850.1 hypothetical protein BKA55DRAFT_539422 [Fusarium redolens]
MDTEVERRMSGSFERRFKSIPLRQEGMSSSSQVVEVHKPVESEQRPSYSTPAEENNETRAKKMLLQKNLEQGVSNTVLWEIVSPFDTSVTTLLFQHSNLPNPIWTRRAKLYRQNAIFVHLIHAANLAAAAWKNMPRKCFHRHRQGNIPVFQIGSFLVPERPSTPEPPSNRNLEETSRYRRAIDAPEIASFPSQQEGRNLPSGPSTEMRENPSPAEANKQKTVESISPVGNVSDPDQTNPAEASTSWKLPEVAKQPPLDVRISREVGRSAVGTASVDDTNASKDRINTPASGFIDEKTNVGPRGDIPEEETEEVVTFPDPLKDEPKRSTEEAESKAEGEREAAQPIAS